MKEKDSENWVLRWGWGVCGIHLHKGKGFTKCGVKGVGGGGGGSLPFIYMKT